jgi:NAD-dependent SIR2 family protein deacetylase
MPQLFRPSANSLAKIAIAGALILVSSTIGIAYVIDRGPWITDVGVAPVQPIYFSHKHHVKDDGIDCRYCHSSVENSATAGIPPTETCMSCHSQIWNNAVVTEPIRQSWATGKSIEWTKVHDLPDYVYFNHSIHIAKGVGCSTCHGQINEMPWVYKVNTLYMNWCISCHRNPGANLRPRSEIFNMDYKFPANQAEVGAQLVKEYHVQSLVDCATCHR